MVDERRVLEMEETAVDIDVDDNAEEEGDQVPPSEEEVAATVEDETTAVEEATVVNSTVEEETVVAATVEEETYSKKRKVKKRLVGSYSTSIKQMKDAVVRTQAMIAASKISTIQTMTSYATVTQAHNNPKSDTILLNYDEIVERPDKNSEGERARLLPKWTILAPQGTHEKEMGVALEKLGKAMQEEKKRGSKKKSIKQEKEFEYDVVDNYQSYLASIYGSQPGGPSNKKPKTEKKKESK